MEWLAVLMRQKHGLAVAVRSRGEKVPKPEEQVILLYQSVRELLFNVVKHARVTQASVSIDEGKDGVTLVVQDGGAGFDTRLLERSPRAFGGFGIFSIRERLALHGGRLDIESAPGKGSRFTLWLPFDGARGKGAGRTAAPAGTTAALGSSGGSSSRIRVLIADDHPVVRRGMVQALREHADIEVVGEAPDGRQAVEMTATLSPDVVIMDMRMPGMPGVEATRAILRDHPRVRIIGFSALDDPEEARLMREAGAVGYHVKTGPPSRLLAAIRACADPDSPPEAAPPSPPVP